MLPATGSRHDAQMSKIKIDDAGDLAVRDVLHAQMTALEATATVADARAYFAASTSRRMALVCDDGRYVGSLTPAQLEGADLDRRSAGRAARADRPMRGSSASSVSSSMRIASAWRPDDQ